MSIYSVSTLVSFQEQPQSPLNLLSIRPHFFQYIQKVTTVLMTGQFQCTSKEVTIRGDALIELAGNHLTLN